MIRAIIKHGDPVLGRRADRVDRIDDEVERLIDDMVATMYAAPGIGLAAPQVGVALRVCVIDLGMGKRGGDVIALVNPELVVRDGMQVEDEGCLSVPGFTASVGRPARVVVRGLDRHGHEKEIEGTGLLARALQHEIDHLEGTLFLDRLRGIKRDMILRRIRKLNRTGRW